MKSKRRTLSAAGCGLVVILLMLTGCAALTSLTTTQETLENRVKNYMQAQVDRKWDTAYSFFDASSRRAVSRESYLAKPRKMSYGSFSIEEITVLPSGNQATVKVRTETSFMGYVFPRMSQIQTWVKQEEGWFVKLPAPPSQKDPFSTKKKTE